VLLAGIASAGTSYIHSNGQLIAKINETGNITYYHSDHLGSTSIMTDSRGEVVEEQKNLPFGELIQGDERYGFTMKELDETDLQYFGVRYYNPEVGRFLTIDPLLQYASPYIYAGDNPLRYVDPTGAESWEKEYSKYSPGEQKTIDGIKGALEGIKKNKYLLKRFPFLKRFFGDENAILRLADKSEFKGDTFLSFDINENRMLIPEDVFEKVARRVGNLGATKEEGDTLLESTFIHEIFHWWLTNADVSELSKTEKVMIKTFFADLGITGDKVFTTFKGYRAIAKKTSSGVHVNDIPKVAIYHLLDEEMAYTTQFTYLADKLKKNRIRKDILIKYKSDSLYLFYVSWADPTTIEGQIFGVMREHSMKNEIATLGRLLISSFRRVDGIIK